MWWCFWSYTELEQTNVCDKNKSVPNAMLAHNTFHSTVTCKSIFNSSSIFYNKEKKEEEEQEEKKEKQTKTSKDVRLLDLEVSISVCCFEA